MIKGHEVTLLKALIATLLVSSFCLTGCTAKKDNARYESKASSYIAGLDGFTADQKKVFSIYANQLEQIVAVDGSNTEKHKEIQDNIVGVAFCMADEFKNTPNNSDNKRSTLAKAVEQTQAIEKLILDTEVKVKKYEAFGISSDNSEEEIYVPKYDSCDDFLKRY